jgi:hypothetical protein
MPASDDIDAATSSGERLPLWDKLAYALGEVSIAVAISHHPAAVRTDTAEVGKA